MTAAFIQVAIEHLRLSQHEYESVKASKEYQENRIRDITDYWEHKGGCDEMWRDFQSFEKHYGQKKPQLKGNDPSKPFDF